MRSAALLFLSALLLTATACERSADIDSPKTFDNAKISFQYPGNWTVTDQPVEGGSEILIETPGDAIMSVLVMEPKVGASLDAFAQSMIEIRQDEFEKMFEAGGGVMSIGPTSSKEVSTAWSDGSRRAIEHSFSVTALGESVPHVALFHLIESPTRDGFVMSQVANEDLPKVKPGFKLVWTTIKVK